MQEIIKEVEFISGKLVELEKKYNLRESHDMNLLWWKWHEERRGLIKAAGMLGVTIEVADTDGLKWQARVVHG